MAIYDQIRGDASRRPEFRPRALFERFNIEVLCTTDAATDTLEHQQPSATSGWNGVVRPTFRPDLAINILHPNWHAEIDRLRRADRATTITTLRRLHPGARAPARVLQVDGRHGDRPRGRDAVHVPSCRRRGGRPVRPRARRQGHRRTTHARFTGHMLMEMARMSVEDGLVMQLHPGSDRNHNALVFETFGPDRGCDIPLQTEYTRNLQAAAQRLRQRPPADAGPVHARRDDLLARAGAAGRPLPVPAPGAAVVVPRQHRGHDALPVPGRPKRPASTTPPASTTTRARSRRSRRGTTCAAASTPTSWPTSSAGTSSSMDEAREMMRALTYDLVKATYRLN